jgi:hypothetical protein
MAQEVEMGNPTVPSPAVSVPAAKASRWADKLGESAFGDLLARLTRQEQNAADQKAEYADKLETATGGDVFKYFLLINVASLEKYVAQTRIQAQLSFRLCERVSQWAFFLILLGVFMAIVSPLLSLLSAKWPALGTTTVPLAPAGLAALAGIITQFISSVFFYFYNRTLQQFNLFGEKLSAAERVAISLLVNGTITDDAARNTSSAELAKALLASSAPPEPQAQGKQAEAPVQLGPGPPSPG